MRKAHLILVGLLLSFAVNATNDIPRPEYPRPQFERTTWVNLNGAWTYEFDFNNSGEKRNLQAAKSLSKQIMVPFCPESKLSGVNHTNFIKKMWYQRSLSIPSDWNSKKSYFISVLSIIQQKSILTDVSLVSIMVVAPLFL